MRKLGTALERRFGPNAAFWDERVPFGTRLEESLDTALKATSVVVVAVGPYWKDSHGSTREAQKALALGKPVIPVLVQGASWRDVPPELRELRCTRVSKDSLETDLQEFVEQSAISFPDTPRFEETTAVDIDDPHKGQFGGQSERAGRRVTARVTEGRRELLGTREWFNVRLVVGATDDRALNGDVEFYLQPSFRPPMVRVPV